MSHIPESQRIPLSAILTAGLQIRTETNRAHVDDLAELLGDDGQWPAALPAVVVFGADPGPYFVGDGHHRLQAAQEAGCTSIPCQVHAGGHTEALWYACGANSSHGLRRTSEDKRNAVRVAYRLDPSLSDNAIAKRCHVSPDMANYTLRPLRSNAPLSESDSGASCPPPSTPTSTATASTETDPSTLPLPAGPAPDIRVDARGRRMNVVNIGKAKATSPAPAVSAPRPVDELGVPIPSEAVEQAFVSLDYFADLDSDLARVAKKINDLAQMPGTELLRANHLKITRETRNGEQVERFHSSDLKNLRQELSHWKPHAVCPHCRERINPGCGACKGLGWVTQTAWDRCPERVRTQALETAAPAEPEAVAI